MTFDGEVFAVTGAASGIGLETARQLLAAGASVAALDVNEEELQTAQQELGKLSGQFIALPADTADTQAMKAAMEATVDRFGRLDGLVANAGIRMQSTPITELDDEIWDRIIRVNLRGAFVACKQAAPHMIKHKAGAIVTVSSISGKVGRLDQSAYCASKAGVIQLSRALAVELAGKGIRVNSVCPGTVATGMLEKAQTQDGANILEDRIHGSPTRFRSGIPLRKIAESIDVAETIVFLLSAAAGHVTGQTIFVDGGESIV